MKKRAITAVLWAILSIVCATTAWSTGFPLGKTFTNEYFTMQYPQSWTASSTDYNGREMIYFIGEGNSGANMSVTYTRNTDDIDTSIEIAISMLEQSVTDFKLLNRSCNAMINHYPAHVIEYTYVISDVKVKGVQFYIQKQNLAYIITLTSTADSFQKKWPLFKKIFNTIELF